MYVQKEVPISENLLEYYRKPDGTTKKKILGCIFAENLVLETRSPIKRDDAVPLSVNGKVATLSLILNFPKKGLE